MNKIQVATETASGPSRVTAFDKALTKLGIQNYNLVEYSSVIPSGTTVETKEQIESSHPFGSVCGVVMAVDYAHPESEDAAYTELNWHQSEYGGGFFIESSGRRVSEDELQVMKDNRDISFDGESEKASCMSEKSDNEYSCSVSIAFYGRIETEYKVVN